MATETIHLKIDTVMLSDVKLLAYEQQRTQSDIQRRIFELGLAEYRKQHVELSKLKALNNINI